MPTQIEREVENPYICSVQNNKSMVFDFGQFCLLFSFTKVSKNTI